MEATVRKASRQDVEAIATIHATSWAYAYRGMISDDYLDALTPSSREPMWQDILEAEDLRVAVWVAEAQGRLVGFCWAGPPQGEDNHIDRLEIYTLYLAPDHMRRGIGSLLMQAISDHAHRTGTRHLMLWVLRDNAPARAFYEAHGWTTYGTEKHAQLWMQDIIEVPYRKVVHSAI